MANGEERWPNGLAALWTLVLAAGYFGRQALFLLGNPPEKATAWRDMASTAVPYWALLTASAAYWVYLWLARRRA